MLRVILFISKNFFFWHFVSLNLFGRSARVVLVRRKTFIGKKVVFFFVEPARNNSAPPSSAAFSKTKINQQPGLNGPDKAQTLTTTVRLKSIEYEIRHATDALKQLKEQRKSINSRWRDELSNEIPHAEEVGRAPIAKWTKEHLTFKWWGRSHGQSERTKRLTFKWWGRHLC